MVGLKWIVRWRRAGWAAAMILAAGAAHAQAGPEAVFPPALPALPDAAPLPGHRPLSGAASLPGAPGPNPADPAPPVGSATPSAPPAASALPQGLPPELQQAWKKTGLPLSSLSLVVRQIDGPGLVSINAAQPRNPASVMKLVTTWAALAELGPGYVWRTELLADPGVRPDAKGALAGPLYLRAGGDPQMTLTDMWSLLRELRLRGIRQIPDLVVDRSIFGDVGIDTGAFDGAADRPYNASPDALMVGFGAMRLIFLPEPATRTWRPVMDPPLPGVTLEGRVEWSDVRCPGPPVVGTQPLVTAQGVTVRLSGKVAGSCGEFSLYRLALEQPAFSAAVIRHLWQELGGTMTGRVRAGKVPPDAVLLAAHESPPLGDVIRTINKRSNNVMARTVLLTLGAERGARPATVQGAGMVARTVLARQGLPMPELNIENGSGLSRTGAVSAASLAQLLDVAWHSPLMPEFVSSLAIAGVDGTVRRRLRGNPARGQAHLKTGSLRDVRAIAGYVMGESGRRYLVVSLVNHEQAAAVRSFDDALVAWLSTR